MPVFSWNAYHLEYTLFGNGPEILFAFHGFDNDAEDFRVFEQGLGKKYTLVSINLFFHGKSRFDGPPDHADFTDEKLGLLFSNLLFELKVKKFSLMGYSLGGRVALSLLTLFPERIRSVILLAPDGVKISPWYKFLTRNRVGIYLFRRAVRNPSGLFYIGKFLRALKILGEKQYKFALLNFDNEQKRKKVYNVWMIFREILPVETTVKSLAVKYEIPLILFFGKFDTIIPPVLGMNFLLGYDGPSDITVLDAGHQLMSEAAAKKICEYLEKNHSGLPS